jgi:uncharacterized protein
MKITIGILSDTHLNKVNGDLEDIYDRYLADKDYIIHTGDFVSPQIVEFFDRGNFYGVQGNMDPHDIGEMLPVKREIKLGGHKIGIMHGYGSYVGLENRIWREFPDTHIIVYGHSHRPVCYRREGVLFFNPGSATGGSRAGPNSIGILEIDDTVTGKIVPIQSR